ncbi:hypothetical protein [Pseudobdellovibrio exovorus]|uniref:Lipoprotein n=1 Tax=Pseudobdellovibrio exovorus JSS TaxID=1184267 RepID=M4VDT8_9BACT|nr:hypothetical protein [Pseudobdellovibrio exovorus]AGH96206.1 hypothetical protein A11Q_1990 [Pseudobdellovibrio exovorus JSS]
MRWLVVCFLMTTVGLSSCTNVLGELGDANSDEALLYEAKAAVDNKKYQEAIDIITQRVSWEAQQSVQAKEILASGYAGRCGLHFVNYTQKLIAVTSPTPSVFKMLASPFVYDPQPVPPDESVKHISPESCVLALQTLSAIDTRTAKHNTFAAVLGMVLVGTATRLYTDNVPVGGDGITDFLSPSGSIPTSTACELDNTQVDHVILGYGHMVENFQYLSVDQIGQGSSSTIQDAINVCGGSCATTDPAQITGTMRFAMRSLMNTADYGVGTANAQANPPEVCPP